MFQIDHYQSAHGPTIWLEIDSAPDLARLHSIFLMLARGSSDDIELCSTMAARAVGLGELRLRLDPNPRARRMRLIRAFNYQPSQESKPRPQSFVWSDTRMGWKRQARIVDSLLRESGTAHRDLSEEGVDDALIELSFQLTG
jgi:hypothetical protein